MRKKRKLLIIAFIPVLLLAVAVAFLMLMPRADDAVVVTGAAEAVMVTQVTGYDGLWDPKRHSDELYFPIGLAMKDGQLIVADSMCDRIQIFDGNHNKRVGRPGQYGLSYLDSGALVDGYRENAMFMKPAGVSVSPDGIVIIADTGNHVIRRMDDDFVITIAGNGISGYQEGKEGGAQFHSPRAAVAGHDGFIYVADTMNHCIRRIDSSGTVTLFAGTPQVSGYRDGQLQDAQFFEPAGLHITPDGELYVADSANHSIRKISIADGICATVVGLPGPVDRLTGYPGGGYIDGDNQMARLNFPRDVHMLADGSLIVADSLNHAIRLVTGQTTRTLAGNGMAGQFYDSAENMRLTRPEGVYSDGETLFISDTLNNRVVSLPLNERLMAGRPGRREMLEGTGITLDSKYPYNGDIRVHIDGKKADMGRVVPWNSADFVYIPIRPLFEALGAGVALDEKAGALAVTIADQDTILKLNEDYFILKGVAVTTIEEIYRLFPYTFEWFPDYSLIALHIPADLLPVSGGG